MRQLAVSKEETIFVGDADVDVLAGVAGGVRTLLICHDRPVDAAIRAKAWKTVQTPAEAYAVVRGELAAR